MARACYEPSQVTRAPWGNIPTVHQQAVLAPLKDPCSRSITPPPTLDGPEMGAIQGHPGAPSEILFSRQPLTASLPTLCPIQNSISLLAAQNHLSQYELCCSSRSDLSHSYTKLKHPHIFITATDLQGRPQSDNKHLRRPANYTTPH